MLLVETSQRWPVWKTVALLLVVILTLGGGYGLLTLHARVKHKPQPDGLRILGFRIK